MYWIATRHPCGMEPEPQNSAVLERDKTNSRNSLVDFTHINFLINQKYRWCGSLVYDSSFPLLFCVQQFLAFPFIAHIMDSAGRNFKLIVKIPAASGERFFFAKQFSYISISKNVVRENDECQLSNGDCTTKKKCGYWIIIWNNLPWCRLIQCWPSTAIHMVCPYSLEFSDRGLIFLKRLWKDRGTLFLNFWWTVMLSRSQFAVRKAVSVLRHAKNSLFLHTKYENHTSFRSCNLRSTTAIRRSLRQRFLK